jgi:tRNA-dihydrouridine synthase
MSKVPARPEFMQEIAKLRDQIAPGTLIVANGDIENRAHGLSLAKEYHLDGVMIGRGIFHDPLAFAATTDWENYSKQQKIELYQNQVELFQKTWGEGERNIKTLNKFCKVYINGFDGAKELRENLMNAVSAEDLLLMLEKASQPEYDLV